MTRKLIPYAAGVFGLAFLVYANALRNDFNFDDVTLIKNNALVRLSNLPKLLVSNYRANTPYEKGVLLCKESAVMIPAVILLHEWLFQRRARWRSYAGLAGSVLVYLALRFAVLGGPASVRLEAESSGPGAEFCHSLVLCDHPAGVEHPVHWRVPGRAVSLSAVGLRVAAGGGAVVAGWAAVAKQGVHGRRAGSVRGAGGADLRAELRLARRRDAVGGGAAASAGQCAGSLSPGRHL